MKIRSTLIIGVILLALVGSHQHVDAKCGPPDLPCSAPPTTPMESVLNGNENAGSGSPLISWDATNTVVIGIFLFGIVGSITALVFLKSKSLQKY